jgi:signal transduction histidine kinase
MISPLDYLIDTASFVPHAVCWAWRPDLLAMHGISDALIAAAYMTIPLVIVTVLRKRPDLLDTKVAWMFATFITACALSHAAAFLTLWIPYYGMQGLIKIATAAISLYTAYQLTRLLPAFLSMPSQKQMAERDAELILKDREAVIAEKSRQKLDEFASIAAHDLRAPLRSLKIIPTWLLEDLRDPEYEEEKLRKHIDMINTQVDRMDALVVGLLEYSRIGHGDAVPEPVDLRDVVDSVVTLLNPPKEFEIRVEGEIPVLKLVRAEFELVVRNLLGNALKHHDRDHGSIIVRGLGWENDFFKLEVEDDGPGIPGNYTGYVFEKFSRLKSKDDVEGSGMGLAAVERALESIGGTIFVRNKDKGRGAIFEVALRQGEFSDSVLVA